MKFFVIGSDVDDAIERLLDQGPDPEALKRIELGVNHEEQHQELLLTDILHAFFTNPLRPRIRSTRIARQPLRRERRSAAMDRLRWRTLVEIGHTGDTFCYDNELPRHRRLA